MVDAAVALLIVVATRAGVRPAFSTYSPSGSSAAAAAAAAEAEAIRERAEKAGLPDRDAGADR